MEEQIIEGKLTYVAKTAGLKLNDQSKWYNPTPEAKERILPKMEKLTALIGSQVKLQITDTGNYRSVEIIKAKTEVEEAEEALEEAYEHGEPEGDAAQDTFNAELSKAQDIVDESKSKMTGQGPDNKVKQSFSGVKIEEEKVPPTPPPKEEETEEEIHTGYEASPIKKIFKELQLLHNVQQWNEKYFDNLNKIGCDVAKKNKLNYISWATAWEALKKQHPDATYEVHENKNGMPYFHDDRGAFAKVSVTVCTITHTIHLPVMDFKNKGMQLDEMSTFDINKTVQRALAKAIAMHGLGLYVFRGEDLPDDGQ